MNNRKEYLKWLKHRRQKRVWTSILCGVLLAGAGAGTGYAIWHSQKNNDVVDKTIYLPEMKNYSYVATKHNQINFRNRAFNDKEMINSLSQIIRPNDLMNSIIYYFIKISDNYVVNTPSNESMKLLDALSDASHLHVLYLKKNNDNSFRFYIDFMFDLKTSIKIDELTLTTDDAIEVTVHSRSGFNCYFTKFYYRQNDDVTYDQFKGNNFGITMDTGDTEHFYIETYIYFPSGESLGYEVTKNNWSDVPLVGFDDILLPNFS